MKTVIFGTPFTPHVDQNATPSLENPTDFLKKAYQRFYTNNDNLIRYGHYKLMGYKYDFSKYLSLFLYKQHDNWHEAYAPNKTMLRQVIGGRIDRIIKLEQKEL